VHTVFYAAHLYDNVHDLQVELPGCTGIWTVYHKAQRDSASDIDLVTSKDEEFHAYLIISLGSRTMVLETGDTLGEVTESVEYYTEGGTIIAGNLFGR
jgi:cleavage and polyadenylation specificity factor subunit 1